MPYLTRWNDFDLGDYDRNFRTMDELRRRMDRVFGDLMGGRWPAYRVDEGVHARSWPQINVFDSGNELVIRAEVPGLAEKDLDISLNQGVLTLSGERKVDVPEGFSAHRRERTGVRFSRSFTLPVKADPDQTTATLTNGILTVNIAKAAEAKPRQITVKAQ